MLPGSAEGADISQVGMCVFPNLDIFGSANVLIREHGENAAREAAMRADAMFDRR